MTGSVLYSPEPITAGCKRRQTDLRPLSNSVVTSQSVGYILPPLLRLVLTLGIYCLPSCGWFSRWVYTASPPAVGSHTGYILPPLLRLVLTL
eukprot:356902-Pyramimonas_sp.AAC.1